jgi:hypothetical protein
MFYLVGIGGLVVERERNCVRERPLEKGVVLSRQDFDVNGDVSSFSRPVTIQEQWRLNTKQKTKNPPKNTVINHEKNLTV